MRKFGLLLIPLLFWGCDKTFENVIDVTQENYQVTSVSPTGSFVYNPGDSLITIRINFTSASEVSDVSFDMIASDGSLLNSSPVPLFDNDDNRFTNQFPMSEYYPNGIYDIKYYAIGQTRANALVAWGTFNYDNGQTNIAPVISNIVAPDTAVIGVDTTIFVSVDVHDDNGLNDIDVVFFNSFLPDSTPSSGNPFIMFDDGTNGDLVPGDGTYSLIVELPSSGVARGTYRWEFQAMDRGGKSSNIIIHFLEII
ncbi:MAG: hypothetical protein DRQ13_01410 [Ignavibacteriae bacterium]|nr:MAG: hypothetical protein DRQ13_01410 [Ignavibacteriota bacterium]